MTNYVVSSGQTNSGITLNNGDTETVLSGGTASATVIRLGGVENVSAGGVTNNTVVSSGGVENVSSGGRTNTAVVSAGGIVNILSGGVDSATLVNGGAEIVLGGGRTFNDIVTNGTQTVQAGGTTSATALQYTAVQNVASGATTFGTTIANSAVENISSGGSAQATALNNSAVLNVLAWGSATGTVVTDGSVNVQGTAVGNTFRRGAENVLAGGAVIGTILSSGGVQHVSSGGSATNTLVGSGGVEQILAGSNVAGTQVLSGGALNLASVAFVSGGTASIDANDVLTITEGGKTYTQTLSGSYKNEYFHLAGAAAGTLVTLDSTPCYCRGTLILTDAGERAVEHVAVGDLVVTLNGSMPVKWIGRRSYSGRFARGNRAVLPIRVAAGAIADGMPSRDLWVSPKHALLIDGVLVPAEVLVNGLSITQVAQVDQVEYFHIELDRHAILFADGAPAESFVDDDSRGMFQNAHEHAARYPDAPQAPAIYCAPRHEDGERVEAIRRRLAQRADPAASVADGLGALRGSVDALDGERLYGWAQHAARLEVPVCLEVALGDVVVARVLADRYRDDLRRGALGSGRHAFEATLPEAVLAEVAARGVQALRVRRISDGDELTHPIRHVEDRAA